ncbi:Putative aliphatic sulfonates-binding protein precursor [Nonomuraea coxensis DSM 45129]|uniref:Aliphatic sulfonates-binding protein n=1 Tax=Nonomuraea coxensis DSM 45129 TaxID=1122611 RepID=A0ABX8TUZ2_9ACTN|nr:ABC transporter substrate-binding protein [Nonomuraea coxensis]QYC38354.1 Putative aliphatic sulfonates-binding protein precursor [Nonomuraea coxensis DSM 45129]
MTWLGDQLGRIADEMPQRDLGARAMERYQRRRRNRIAFAAAATVVVTLLAATVGVRALPTERQPAVGPTLPVERPTTEPAERPTEVLERPTIKVGMLPTVESAVLPVAQRMGYFEEEGLNVLPVFVSGSAAAAPLLAQGLLDLAQLDYATVLEANEQGKDLRIAAASHQAAPGTLALVVNATSKVRTVADLKGKRIAVTTFGTVPLLALTALLERAGLTRKDVVLAETTYPQMLGAMKQGRFDAALLAEPFVTAGRQEGLIRVVADAMTGDFANLQTSGMTATERWIARNPRTLAAFLRALGKARRLVAADPEHAHAVLPTYTRLPQYTRISEGAGGKAVLGSYPGKVDLAHLRRIAALAHAQGLLDRLPDPAASVAKTK